MRLCTCHPPCAATTVGRGAGQREVTPEKCHRPCPSSAAAWADDERRQRTRNERDVWTLAEVQTTSGGDAYNVRPTLSPRVLRTFQRLGGLRRREAGALKSSAVYVGVTWVTMTTKAGFKRAEWTCNKGLFFRPHVPAVRDYPRVLNPHCIIGSSCGDTFLRGNALGEVKKSPAWCQLFERGGISRGHRFTSARHDSRETFPVEVARFM